jgi:hypothetical protein
MELITAEHIAQIAILFGALVSGYISLRTYQSAARKDEVCRLEARLEKTEKKLDREIAYRIRLLDYIGALHHIMQAAGLNVPPIPQPEPEKDDEAK